MTTVAPQPVATRPRPKRTTVEGSFLARAFRTTDHKQIGAFILGASMLPFLYNAFESYRYGEVVTVDDPSGYGNSL
ncbi:hypothetical protein SAMN05216215_101455 [Saccharopolyspora shandongensis]|uniref:Uncharacterized protein n=1 Tax=Saccharopolyspora shandongensis TaxID=418495 RepID=A0A1H3E385_9PSEU|nr:hypothetical protein SAMN05216215_101455 [Saccharopolyspora shandongensis]